MPDDLSGFVVEFGMNLRYGERIDMTAVVMRTVMLRGREDKIPMYDFVLDKEDCDLYSHKRLWCSLFGHRDLDFMDAQWMARCYCDGFSIFSAVHGFVHLGRCHRCNSIYLPRARLVER